MNVLYDFPRKKLTRRGELLRIRKYGDTWKLTYKNKGRPGKHKSRQETETKIQDGEKLEFVFGSLGLNPIFRYEKFRSEWSDANGQVVIDQTPIGNFAEIEGPAAWIDTVAASLGVAERDYITQNYATLFLNWKKASRSRAREMTFAAVGKK